MADQYRQLQAHTGYDFSAAIKLLEHLPVFMDGDHHMRVRKAMARQIAGSQKCQFSAAVEKLDDLIATKLLPATKIDLVADFAGPLWWAVSSSIVLRSPATVRLVDDIPGLFNPILSLSKRLDISKRIDAVLRLAGEDAEEELILMGIATLGARPFAGSISLSLYEIIQKNAGKQFSDIAWPEIFPATSLRFVDRICLNPVTIGDNSFEAGEWVRCFAQRGDYTREENNAALFGFGVHSCLGKSISERVWKLVTEKLSQLPLSATPLDLVISLHTDPFYMAQSAYVQLI